MLMEDRKKRVLEAIIKDYIATGEPVGSRTIARKYNLGVSPATIRNEMADLEELGLIEQPHTSAGRIPSNRGYRYYVDCLMKKQKLNIPEERVFLEVFMDKIRETDSLLQRTVRLISQMTNYTAVMTGPSIQKAPFKHIQVLPLPPDKIVLIIVTEGGAVEHRVFEMPVSFCEQDLQLISHILNNKLQGLTFEQLKSSLLQEIYTELSRKKQLLNFVMELLEAAWQDSSEEKIYLSGALNILNQPEFRDIEKVRNLLYILEEESFLRKIVETSQKGVSIKIGEENIYDEVHELSVITATYQIGDQVAGTISIIGPTRMEYARSVAVVEFISDKLSHVMKKIF